MLTLDRIVLDESVRDRLIWTPMATGRYSYRSFRSSFVSQSPVVPIWKVIWRVPVSLKINAFIWLLIKQRLPLRERLSRLHIVSASQNICSLCGSSGEFFSHLFILCDHVSSLWYQVADFWEVDAGPFY